MTYLFGLSNKKANRCDARRRHRAARRPYDGGVPAARSIIDVLTERVRTDGSRPLLTYYNPAKGERVEFSGRSFANWVDKTANLLATLGVEEMVAGPVSVQHPGHWMSLIWPLAAWQRGLIYAAAEPPLPDHAELVVIGPEHPQPLLPGATIACSLHPLGLGLSGLPAGVMDYTGEALAEPDAHWAASVDSDEIAWVDGLARDQSMTAPGTSGNNTEAAWRSWMVSTGYWVGSSPRHADWLALKPASGRALVRPSTPRATLAEALIRPLLGGGSAVVVDGPVAEGDLARIIASERVDHEAGETTGPHEHSYPGVGRESEVPPGSWRHQL